MTCDKCGAVLEMRWEEYGDFAGPEYPCCVMLFKRKILRHPRNGCQFQEFKAREAT